MSTTPSTPATVSDVLVIGAGPGGIATAIILGQHGIDDVRLLERAPEPGGTWYNNRYPGLACDICGDHYSFSFHDTLRLVPRLPPTGGVPAVPRRGRRAVRDRRPHHDRRRRRAGGVARRRLRLGGARLARRRAPRPGARRRRRHVQRAGAPGHRRPRPVPGAGRAHRRVAARRRGRPRRRQAGRRDRLGGQRRADDPDDRAPRRPPRRLPAHGELGVPQGRRRVGRRHPRRTGAPKRRSVGVCGPTAPGGWTSSGRSTTPR